ncbi:hypothetical protein CK203_010034 [Vitis vinifera]|uniref:Uncharacterized protein n=1 Tax=Vitis vinifera TaxID=29760 RepID=A0A438JVC1_VITVI|nr:hypothetical protein CK203_010034 [Vitis vinifera]
MLNVGVASVMKQFPLLSENQTEETKGWIHKVNRKRSWHTDDDEFEGEEENVKEFVKNLPLDAVTYPSFQGMINAIGQYGVGVKPPTYYEVRVPFLRKELGGAYLRSKCGSSYIIWSFKLCIGSHPGLLNMMRCFIGQKELLRHTKTWPFKLSYLIWNPCFSRVLNDWEVEEAERFLEHLHGKRVLGDVDDMVVWTETKSGKFWPSLSTLI